MDKPMPGLMVVSLNDAMPAGFGSFCAATAFTKRIVVRKPATTFRKQINPCRHRRQAATAGKAAK